MTTRQMTTRNRQLGIRGAMITLSPFPLWVAGLSGVNAGPTHWRWFAALASVAGFLLAARFLQHKRKLGVIAAVSGFVSCWLAWLPSLIESPSATLVGTVLMLAASMALIENRPVSPIPSGQLLPMRSLQRARWSYLCLMALSLIAILMKAPTHGTTVWPLAVSILITLHFHWTWTTKIVTGWRRYAAFSVIPLVMILTATGIYLREFYLIMGASAAFAWLTLTSSDHSHEQGNQWWEVMLDRPAKMILSSFLALCLLGSILLSIPLSGRTSAVSAIDAAFTSFSAVCVTGLSVVDTAGDFSFFGQLSILVLIQCGGLGIMTFAAAGLHWMGKRMSLKQELILSNIAQTDQAELGKAMGVILKFTFLVECIGAIALTLLFLRQGDAPLTALWRGVFTSISAFCNAGFSLQSDSLTSYQHQPGILHTTAILIILGGLAPATSLLIPRWCKGKSIPEAARLSLKVSFFLLIGGTAALLAIEWDGMLAGLPIADKLHNAWFQSVTLRTAGFNSVDISLVCFPMYLIMITFMFIGGSPGSTAGGIKTTTFAILALTFISHITNRNEVVYRNRRIAFLTVYRALTITTAGIMLAAAIVIMLEVTQNIPSRDLLFEAVSAIGTVGLSTGATAHLNEMGKVIVMFAMFAGRIGPLTLFMLLADDRRDSMSHCPEARISLN
jgi:trk system potassium uptake protein TrkH